MNNRRGFTIQNTRMNLQYPQAKPLIQTIADVYGFWKGLPTGARKTVAEWFGEGDDLPPIGPANDNPVDGLGKKAASELPALSEDYVPFDAGW